MSKLFAKKSAGTYSYLELRLKIRFGPKMSFWPKPARNDHRSQQPAVQLDKLDKLCPLLDFLFEDQKSTTNYQRCMPTFMYL